MSIQFKRGTQSNWESVNPVLADGQPGVETFTTGTATGKRLKIGDGTSTFTNLPYLSANLNIVEVDSLDFNANSTGSPSVTQGCYYSTNCTNVPNSNLGTSWYLTVYCTNSFITQIAISDYPSRSSSSYTVFIRSGERISAINPITSAYWNPLSTISQSTTPVNGGIAYSAGGNSIGITPDLTITQLTQFYNSFIVETGTWTPTPQTNLGATITLSGINCTYVRVGSLCYISGIFTIPSNYPDLDNGSTSNVYFTGLPYVTVTTTGLSPRNPMRVFWWNTQGNSPTFDYSLYFTVGGPTGITASRMSLRRISLTGEGSYGTSSDFYKLGQAQISFSGWYPIDVS